MTWVPFLELQVTRGSLLASGVVLGLGVAVALLVERSVRNTLREVRWAQPCLIPRLVSPCLTRPFVG